VFLSVHGEVSIKPPTPKLHHLNFFSDILVVSYVLACAEPAESDSNGAYRTCAAMHCMRRQDQARRLTNKSLAAFREMITNYQYINEEETPIEDCTIGKETQPDTEKEAQSPHDPLRCKISRESSSGKSPKKTRKTDKKKQKNRKQTPQTSPSQVILRKEHPSGNSRKPSPNPVTCSQR